MTAIIRINPATAMPMAKSRGDMHSWSSSTGCWNANKFVIIFPPGVGTSAIKYLIDGIAGEEAGVPVVGGVGHVETAEDFDGGVLSKYGIVDAVLGTRLSEILRTALATSQVVALLIAQRRLFRNIESNVNVNPSVPINSLWNLFHLFAGAVPQTQSNVALVINRSGVREFVRLELDRSLRLVGVVLEWRHQFAIHWATANQFEINSVKYCFYRLIDGVFSLQPIINLVNDSLSFVQTRTSLWTLK